MAPTSTGQAGGWDRRRLLAGLAAAAVAAALLMVGLVYAVYSTVTSASRSDVSSPTAGEAPGGRRPLTRDEIAGEPMVRVAPADARPTTPAATTPAVIEVPAAKRTGPADVPTGFSPTPAGAVGQLAAIETTVLQGMSIRQTNDIHREWALPGGVGVAGWELTKNVQAFLGSAQMSQTMDLAATLTATPVAGQVKGVDGPDWVVACVLLEVRAVITAESEMGYGYCERMQWHRGRWMIAPGTPAAKAPSTWPGSEVSARAGWRTWVDAGGE